MAKNIVCLSILFFSLLSLAGQERSADSCIGLEVEEFYLQLHSSSLPVLVDVRTWDEFRKERIRGAVLAESREILGHLSDTMDLDQPVFIYCEAETRSLTACMFLREKGFTGVYYLKGGLTGWKLLEYETDRKNRRRKKTTHEKSSPGVRIN